MTDHGPKDGTPVLLIHGWPDNAQLWRNQIPALTEVGYRILAPDVRGYGRSDKPESVNQYQVGRVATDFIAILDHESLESAHVIGHDWGASLAWYLALSYPNRFRSLVALSVGHPLAFRRAGFGQLRRSWYMLLFQFEGIAERWLADDDWARFRAFSGGHPETETWIENLSGPGALSGSLGLYRANMGPENLVAPEPDLPLVTIPTMGIWSTRDFALTEHQMSGSAEFVEAEFRYERIEDASHWIPLDAPDDLNSLLIDWLGSH